MSKKEESRPSKASLKKAALEVERYKLTIERTEEGEWLGSSVEIPTVFARAQTVEECLRETRSALTIAIAVLIDQGRPVPAPSSEAKRDQQVNVRLTAEEKLRLEAASRNCGFRSVSDFIRAVVLKHSANGSSGVGFAGT